MNECKANVARSVIAAMAGAVSLLLLPMLPVTSLAQTQLDPPQNVRAAADVADALRITWDAPNAQPTTSYTLRWRKITDENSAYDSADTRDTRDITYTILALTVGATYEVQVQAVNPDGMSEFAPDPAITAVPLRPPGAPPVLVAEPGEKQLKLFWEMPASTGGAPITSYTLRWKPQDDVYTPEAAALTGAESETLAIGYIIPNLVSGRLYDVQVAAVNQFGAGAYVMTSAAPTLAAPQNLQVTASIGKVDMEWEAPLLENGARLTNYVVRWVKVPDDQGDRLRNLAIKILFGLVGVAPTDRGTADITDITKTAHTISGLCSGGVYKMEVAAWNGIVQGDASETTTSVATDAPQNLKVTAGIHTLGVRWDAPAAGEAVLSYRLRWGKDPEFAPQDIAHLDAATTARTIAGLEAKIAYYVQVDAATSAGDGVCSATAKTVTKEFTFTLDVNDDGAENAHDGILISRYLLGVRGEALIHGQTDNSAETVEKIIKEGMKNDKLKVITTEEDGKGPQWEDGIEVAKFLLGISPKTEEAAEKIRALSGQSGD